MGLEENNEFKEVSCFVVLLVWLLVSRIFVI